MRRKADPGDFAGLPPVKPLGWREIVRRVWFEVGDDRALLVAGGVTYYMLLALVPTLAVVVSLYGLFSDPTSVNDDVNLLVGLLPPGGVDIIREQLERLTAVSEKQLSVTLAVSLVVAFWSAGAGIRALIDAMNIAYDVTEKRPFFQLNIMALIFTLAMLVTGVAFVTVLVVMPPVLHALALDRWLSVVVRIVGYGLLLGLLVLGLDVLFRFGPYREEKRWRWLSPGTNLSVIGIAVVAVAFSWYAANFSNYNATYGSLGALVGFLTWIWLSVTIVIVGAELNAVLEHHVRDEILREEDPNSG